MFLEVLQVHANHTEWVATEGRNVDLVEETQRVQSNMTPITTNER